MEIMKTDQAVRMRRKDIFYDPFTYNPLIAQLLPVLKISQNDVVVVVLLFYVHGKHLRSCRDGQLT